MTRMMLQGFPKFFELPARDRWTFLSVWMGCAVASILVPAIGLRASARWLIPKTAITPQGQPADAPRLSRLVNAAARRVPWPVTCLPRSLVLLRELRRRGIASEICLGVPEVAARELQAHAWVEVEAAPIGEGVGTRDRYRVIARLSGSAFAA